MKKTIHFVQVNDVIGTNIVLPLAVGILWTYALTSDINRTKWQLGQVVYKRLTDNKIQEIAQGDIVCFSTYIWNTQYHLQLACQIKEINPNVFIVMGGPDVSADKKQFLHDNQDIVDLFLVGEGEHSVSKLLEAWPNIDLKEIPGALTVDYFDGIAPRVLDLTTSVGPYLAGFYNDIVDTETAAGYTIHAVIQTNRGCPYSCSFCDSGTEYKSKIHFYNFEQIKKEIEWCARHQVEFLSLADDNWGISDRDVELMRWIRDCKLKYGYPHVVDATYAKNAPERLLAMAKIDQEHNTGLIRGITIALQSTNQLTLKAIRRFNLMPEKQVKLIAGLNRLNIPTYTEMIWPLPYETVDTFLQGMDETIDIGLTNWLDVHPLTMFVGTELHRDFGYKVSFVTHCSDDVPDSQKETVNILVNKTQWVDTDDIVEGHVLYAWTVCLYFFGFARPTIHALKERQNKTVTETVRNFVKWIEDNPNCNFSSAHNKLKSRWKSWLTGEPAVDLGIFPKHDTDYWKSYGHLASWLRKDSVSFYQDLQQFVDSQNIDHDTTLDADSIVQFPGKFKNLFEFCRYYYWWRRMTGEHRKNYCNTYSSL